MDNVMFVLGIYENYLLSIGFPGVKIKKKHRFQSYGISPMVGCVKCHQK
jgi:hypothetical protein